MGEVLKIGDLTPTVLPDGREGGYLAFDLRDLLALIAEEGPTLSWAIMPFAEGLYLTAESHVLGISPDELSERIERERGLSLEWHELVGLSESILQTIWGSFVACRPPDDPKASAAMFLDDWCYLDRAKPGFYEYVEVAFQAVDSSFWLVYARDEALRERIAAEFRTVERLLPKPLG